MQIASIVLSSEDSLRIQFQQKICSEVNQYISLFVETFEQFTKDIPEILEIVPTYCSVTIFFDYLNCKAALVKEIAEDVLANLQLPKGNKELPSRIIQIPVCYDDDEFAPDLGTVASHANLNEEQVIQIHSSPEYLIHMMGFLPGFPYLGGLDERLETPRLETPRTKIPAGSVAIGGKQTGLYPVESPGGWQIIGRTPLKVFDLQRNPVFLYKAGDKLKFIPITRKEFDSFDEQQWLQENLELKITASAVKEKPSYACGGGIRILEPGLCSTVQDSGTVGFQRFGIGQSGAMDWESYALANRLCKNPESAACIETLISGPEIRFTDSCDFAITGAVFSNATLNHEAIPMNKLVHAEGGDVLSCGFATKGLRSYIAFSGGVLVPQVFGSRSTNLKGKIGGLEGRKLKSGDELALGFLSKPISSSYLSITNPFFTNSEEILTVECLKSSQFDFFDSQAVTAFTNFEYTISTDSDRMGIRLSGPSLNCGKTDIISDSIPFGAVQITSAGLPVVMAADRQTIGGYAKIACVTKKSMCKLVQAAPGTRIRFQFV